ncbi:low molecular weight phosphotyrosine protein phosphatase [Ectothiorhodospiraceae bacterium 2226]|nr:low molecular weight phosphotyrosine protein phosphatase [Ectothiorhodospiraceae bacterium 2226]
MGNICRSPTAHGVFQAKVQEAGLAGRVEIDSAGTHDYHVGAPPDSRAQQAALRRGVDLSTLRARAVADVDFDHHDYVLAMDLDNYALLEQVCPPAQRHKLKLFLEFAPDAPVREVPDPYYGGAGGFERVLDLVEQGAEGLLNDIRRRIGR